MGAFALGEWRVRASHENPTREQRIRTVRKRGVSGAAKGCVGLLDSPENGEPRAHMRRLAIFGLVLLPLSFAQACAKEGTNSPDGSLGTAREDARSWSEVTASSNAKREAPADAKEFDGVAGKFEAHFSENPGEGD
jgi:hypothetical protein